MEAGKYLKEKRIEQKVGQVELAKKTGISNHVLYLYESGKRTLKQEAIEKICIELKLNKNYVLFLSSGVDDDVKSMVGEGEWETFVNWLNNRVGKEKNAKEV